MIEDRLAHLDAEFEAGTNYLPNKADWLEGSWSGMVAAHGDDRRGEIRSRDRHVASNWGRMTTPPENMVLNSKTPADIEGALYRH